MTNHLESQTPAGEKSPQSPIPQPPSPSSESWEEVLVKIPGAIVHLIDREQSVELASGELSVVRLWQNGNAVAVLARVGDKIQWPLAKDEATVKLDEAHYFFSLRVPPPAPTGIPDSGDEGEIEIEREGEEPLNYGLTIASKGQEDLLRELDGVLEHYSNFSVQRVGLDGSAASETTPEEMGSEERREFVEESSAAYWTTLAPNVEDYSSAAAKIVAGGSGQLIKGILWCGNLTVDQLIWGNEILKQRIRPGCQREISPEVMNRIERVKMLTKASEEMATDILSGVLKVSKEVTSPLVNSSMGRKLFSLVPGEIVLASMDGLNKVFDAIEVTGKNVMATTSAVTTGLVTQRYGEEAARATNQGFDAAAHAIGTAWAVFNVRKALNPKSVLKPTNAA